MHTAVRHTERPRISQKRSVKSSTFTDTVVVQKARCVEKWRRQGIWFNKILTQVDRAPRNNSWVHQQGNCLPNFQTLFGSAIKSNSWEANPNGSVISRTVHPDLFFVENLGYLSSAIANRTHGMILCQDAPRRVRLIVNVSSVLTSVHLFWVAKIANTHSNSTRLWKHITWYTRLIGYVDLNRDAYYSVPPLAPCLIQSEAESMSESHLSVAFIAAGTVRSWQSAPVSAMCIRAGIVRDLVRDLVRAAHVRATLVRANLLSHIRYSLIHKMEDCLDLRFNHGPCGGKTAPNSTKPRIWVGMWLG